MTDPHCPTCNCDVIARHGRCPWCDTKIHLPVMPQPDIFDELQRVLEATTLMHLTAPKEYA